MTTELGYFLWILMTELVEIEAKEYFNAMSKCDEKILENVSTDAEIKLLYKYVEVLKE